MRRTLSILTLGLSAPFLVAGCAAIYHLDEYSTADVQPDAQARTLPDGVAAEAEAEANPKSDVATRADVDAGLAVGSTPSAPRPRRRTDRPRATAETAPPSA